MKNWVPCWLRVSNKDILVSDTENTHPRYSCTYVEILLIRRARYNNIRRFCIVVQVTFILVFHFRQRGMHSGLPFAVPKRRTNGTIV